jgi:hypothetical protein
LSSSSSYGGPLRPERAGDHREEIWVGDGPIYTKTCDSTSGLVHSSSVKVLDFAGTIKQTIYTGGKARADELCYNPFTNVVLMANDEPVDNFITFISTETYEVLGTIKFDAPIKRETTFSPMASNSAHSIRGTRSSISISRLPWSGPLLAPAQALS